MEGQLACGNGGAARPTPIARRTTMLYDCPECGLPATVTVHGHAASTDGPVEMVALRCVDTHLFFGPGDRLRHLLPEPSTELTD
jgi:hypothetical protein